MKILFFLLAFLSAKHCNAQRQEGIGEVLTVINNHIDSVITLYQTGISGYSCSTFDVQNRRLDSISVIFNISNEIIEVKSSNYDRSNRNTYSRLDKYRFNSDYILQSFMSKSVVYDLTQKGSIYKYEVETEKIGLSSNVYFIITYPDSKLAITHPDIVNEFDSVVILKGRREKLFHQNWSLLPGTTSWIHDSLKKSYIPKEIHLYNDIELISLFTIRNNDSSIIRYQNILHKMDTVIKSTYIFSRYKAAMDLEHQDIAYSNGGKMLYFDSGDITQNISYKKDMMGRLQEESFKIPRFDGVALRLYYYRK